MLIDEDARRRQPLLPHEATHERELTPSPSLTAGPTFYGTLNIAVSAFPLAGVAWDGATLTVVRSGMVHRGGRVYGAGGGARYRICESRRRLRRLMAPAARRVLLHVRQLGRTALALGVGGGRGYMTARAASWAAAVFSALRPAG